MVSQEQILEGEEGDKTSYFSYLVQFMDTTQNNFPIIYLRC